MSYIEKNKEKRFSASDVYNYLRELGSTTNLTTVYRNLEKMIESGILLQLANTKDGSALYQYSEPEKKCQEHLHIQCSECGKIGPGENTARSHGDSFAILPGWLADGRGIAPDDVRIEDLSRENVESFCLWLSDVRGVCAATVNVRLCALRSFASYVSFTEPAYLEWASALRAVEFSKSPSGEVEWLPVEAVNLIMESASSDAREHAMLGLLYDSGARVSEIANARRCDLRLDAPATIRLSGKGRKVRIVPLCDQVAGMASAYLAATAGAPDSPLFASHGGKAIGRAGITYVLKKHVAAAHEADPLVDASKLLFRRKVLRCQHLIIKM